MEQRIEVTVCKTGTGYSAHIEDILGVTATGQTLDEIKGYMLEVLELHLEGLKEDGDPIPEALQGEYYLVFKMDVESLLSYYQGILTQTAISRITGINVKLLNHYAKGLKKPRPAQVRKIEAGLHKLGAELLQLQL